MKTINVNVYSFNELNEKAKENARNYFYDVFSYDCEEEIKEIKELLNYFDVKLLNYQIDEYSCRYSVSFANIVPETKEDTYKLLYENFSLNCLRKKNYYRKGKKRTSKILFSYDVSLWIGDIFLSEIENQIRERKYKDYDSVIYHVLDVVFNALKSDYKFFYEDENIEDMFNANDYFFFSDGKGLQRNLNQIIN